MNKATLTLNEGDKMKLEDLRAIMRAEQALQQALIDSASNIHSGDIQDCMARIEQAVTLFCDLND